MLSIFISVHLRESAALLLIRVHPCDPWLTFVDSLILPDRLLNPTRRYILGRCTGISLGASALDALTARAEGLPPVFYPRSSASICGSSSDPCSSVKSVANSC
jgi:hypothetical protein